MDEESNEKDFFIDKPKAGRAKCKRCKQTCEGNVLRIAKLVPNYFSDSGGKMKHWYHLDCLFQVFKNQKQGTNRIESVEDIEGWDALNEDDKDLVLEKFEGSLSLPPKQGKQPQATAFQPPTPKPSTSKASVDKNCDDNLFVTFRNICDKIAAVSGYIQKSKILQSFLIKGTNGKKFEGDIYLWFKLLLPSAVKRVYNLQSKQLIKVFSRIFRTDQGEMLIDLEKGDVSETIRKYFEGSKAVKPKIDNKLTVYDVDKFLDKLTGITREDDQIECFQKFCQTCSADDLKTVIRLIKHDLRMNAGPRHILDALSVSAYSTFQSSRDLEMVVGRFAPLIAQNKISLTEAGGNKIKGDSGGGSGRAGSGGVQLMSPISPMLAEACKSVETAIAKNPEGVYSEIKYDGERVQIHKRGTEFKFYTRNLKPVMDHKISRCKEFIPKAFPSGKDLILDSEIIVVNTKTGELLPFGTLGVHKRGQFESAEVCLFVFDCIYYNGEDLTKRPLKERKKILKDTMKPIKNHVQLSEYYHLKTKSELASMTANVLKAGLEGLVLKSVNSCYEPGKRGWLKIKKDYLFQGQMADTADLVVLGAWFGTGKKGGMLSIFLMGCHDTRRNQWKTVTKVHSGLDDTTLEELQTELKPLMQRSNPDRPPNWLSCKKLLMPDYVALDATKMPVWEITGAEFTKAEAHTANGISIRFPRITRMRHDKSVREATNLEELELLFKNSKEHINVDMLFKDVDAKNAADMVDIKTKLFDFNKSFDEDADNDDDDGSGDQEMKDDDDAGRVKSKANKNTSPQSMERKKRSSSERDSFSQLTPQKKKRIKAEENSTIDVKNIKVEKVEKYSKVDGKRIKIEKVDDDSKLNAKSSKSPRKKLKCELNEYLDDSSTKFSRKNMDIKVEGGGKIKKDTGLIFNGIVLYVKKNVQKQFKATLQEQYLVAGGKIAENSREATHAVHLENRNNEDFMVLRKKYRAECRHVTYKWIQDSINRMELLPIGNYAVFL